MRFKKVRNTYEMSKRAAILYYKITFWDLL